MSKLKYKNDTATCLNKKCLVNDMFSLKTSLIEELHYEPFRTKQNVLNPSLTGSMFVEKLMSFLVS